MVLVYDLPLRSELISHLLVLLLLLLLQRMLVLLMVLHALSRLQLLHSTWDRHPSNHLGLHGRRNHDAVVNIYMGHWEPGVLVLLRIANIANYVDPTRSSRNC